VNNIKIASIVGTRPEIIKMQPIIKEIQKSKHDLNFIHTGQHYSFNMSNIFIDDLDLPQPNYFLNVKSGSQGVQTSRIIAKCEKLLKSEKPDIVLVQGDTNSALGAAIASSKLGLSIGHVEAGCRSFDKQMPEEINRVLISDIASLHFVATDNCKRNLLKEGIPASQIFVTGHPIVDLIRQIRNRISENTLNKSKNKHYALVTFHRRENIDDKDNISNILTVFDQLSQKMPVIFPCHPHTKRQILRFSLEKYVKNLRMIKPVDYIQSLSLCKNAKFVLTDSGGIQQEAALLCTPCITLRKTTEWIETVKLGINFLAGCGSGCIKENIRYVERNYDDILQRFKSSRYLFGKVGVSKRILTIIEKRQDKK
jgi:UDP-N-acetylglucosamine 2-epimerase (non-hydrolysing)